MTDVYIKEPPYNANDPEPGPPPSLADVRAWEEAKGAMLPEDYRSFITQYKGGTLYPALFLHRTEDPTGDFIQADEEEALDDLFHWSHVSRPQATDPTDVLWRHGLLGIGYDTSGSTICLSLREEDHGAVRWWWRNMASWDEEENGPRPIGTIAPSFRAFVFETLFEDGDDIPRWRIPADLQTAKQVSF